MEKGDLDGAIGYVWGAKDRCDALGNGVILGGCSDGGLTSSEGPVVHLPPVSDSKLDSTLDIAIGLGPARSEEIYPIRIGILRNTDAKLRDQVKDLLSGAGFGIGKGFIPVKLAEGGSITNVKSKQSIGIGVKSQLVGYKKQNNVRKLPDNLSLMGRVTKLSSKSSLVDTGDDFGTHFGLVVAPRLGIGYGVTGSDSLVRMTVKDDELYARCFRILTEPESKIQRGESIVGVVIDDGGDGMVITKMSSLPLSKGLFGGDEGEILVGSRIV